MRSAAVALGKNNIISSIYLLFHLSIGISSPIFCPGNKTKSMLGDEFTKECRSLEKYLQLLLVHPVLCDNENLKKFLIDEEVRTI